MAVEEDHSFRRYPDAYYHTYDVLEFFWKSIGQLLNGRYDPIHLPEEGTFDALMVQARPHIDAAAASRLKQIFVRYNSTWNRNPPDRQRSRYGYNGRTPYDLYTKTLSQTALTDSRFVSGVLAKVNREVRVNSGTIHIGLIDGRFSPSDATEKICNVSPWGDFSSNPLDDWAGALSAMTNTRVTRIPILELTNKYSIVVNPFGETYPDLPMSRNVLPGYAQIQSFIGNGGIFVTAGGHPLTTYFDVTTGVVTDVKRVVRNVMSGQPTAVAVQGQAQVSIPTTNVISDNLLSLDFASETTWDTARQAGPVVTVPRRDPSEARYGNFTLPAQVEEFRAIDPTISPRAIPVVRGRRSDSKEVYLAALVPFGLGYLFHFGLNLGRGKLVEFNFACKGVEAACTNFLSYFN